MISAAGLPPTLQPGSIFSVCVCVCSFLRGSRKSQVLQPAGISFSCSSEKPSQVRPPLAFRPPISPRRAGSAGHHFTFLPLRLPPPPPVDDRGHGGGGDEHDDSQRCKKRLLPAVWRDWHVICGGSRKLEVSQDHETEFPSR